MVPTWMDAAVDVSEKTQTNDWDFSRCRELWLWDWNISCFGPGDSEAEPVLC